MTTKKCTYRLSSTSKNNNNSEIKTNTYISQSQSHYRNDVIYVKPVVSVKFIDLLDLICNQPT